MHSWAPAQRVPRPLDLPWLRPAISMDLKHNTTPEPALARTATIILNRLPPSRRLADDLQLYLDLCYTIDRAKIDLIGRNAPTVNSNGLMRHLAGQIAYRVNYDDSTLDQLDKLKELLGDSDYGWFVPKVAAFHYALWQRTSTLWYASQLPDGLEHVLDKLVPILGDLRQLRREVMAELAVLRRYGVKPAYFTDGILHSPGTAWVLDEPPDHPQASRPSHNPGLAMVALAATDDITDMTFTPVHIEGSRRPGSLGPWQVNALTYPYPVSAQFMLDDQGDLVNFGVGTDISTRELFGSVNRSQSYELLSLTQLMRFYDLVVGIETVEKLPKWPIARTIGMLRKRKLPLTPDLVLQRVHQLSESGRLTRELEREVETADEQAKRLMRKHEVVGHPRDLPPGNHASAEKIAEARANDVELGPNQTWVKKHKRGTLDPGIKAHRARPRRR